VSLYLVEGKDEVLRRRSRVPAGEVVEAWPDVLIPGAYWLGEESRRLLDDAGDVALPVSMTLPEDAVPIYYGARLCDAGSLPREDSLRTRALSVHGIAVAWITLDRFGERTTYQPASMQDPVFYLRRVGTGAPHVWRTFHSRDDAISYLGDAYGDDGDALRWAQNLPAESFEALVMRYGRAA
jgi:hypothetical protein